MQVQWRALPGFRGIYEVSNTGEVHSVERTILLPERKVRLLQRRKLKPYNLASGHPIIYLFNDGVRSKHRVADLIALAFLGPAPEGMEAVHKDGDNTNNDLANLEYGPPVEFRNVGNSKVVDKQVREILASTDSVAVLAKRYRIGTEAIRAIKARKTWKHIE